MKEIWTDARGHEHQPCAFCGVDCSTHPDAGNSLSCCGDCGCATCPDHRVDDQAARCVDCAARFYARANEGEMNEMTNERDNNGTVQSAVCCSCGQEKPVCCSYAYTENEQGRISYVDPLCEDCVLRICRQQNGPEVKR